MRRIVFLLAMLFAVGAIVPRFIAEPAYPQSDEALKVRKSAERLVADEAGSGGIARQLGNALLVQRVLYKNFQIVPGSCSGYSDQPKPNPSDDGSVDVAEIGLFGVQIKSWHAVCGGRIPTKKPVEPKMTKSQWEDKVSAEQREACKASKLNCGWLGDYSK